MLSPTILDLQRDRFPKLRRLLEELSSLLLEYLKKSAVCSEKTKPLLADGLFPNSASGSARLRYAIRIYWVQSVYISNLMLILALVCEFKKISRQDERIIAFEHHSGQTISAKC